MTVTQLETRLRKMERKIADLAQHLKCAPSEKRWYALHGGRFSNDPVFDEIVRLGREARHAANPRPKVKRGRPR